MVSVNRLGVEVLVNGTSEVIQGLPVYYQFSGTAEAVDVELTADMIFDLHWESDIDNAEVKLKLRLRQIDHWQVCDELDGIEMVLLKE